MPQLRPRLNQRGWTLVELMIVTAIIGIITPALTFLFSKCTQGMAADEMHIQLQSLNSLTLLRIHERSTASKHLFQNDTSGQGFQQAVVQGMTASTLANYPIMANSKLPLTQPAPVTSYASFSTSSTGVPDDFGNSLLFGAFDIPQTINNIAYLSPVTVTSNAAQTVAFADGKPATIVVDLYRFYYYYLTENNPKGPKGTKSSRLVEWQSIQYADYYQLYNLYLSTLGGISLMQDVISWLATPGNIAPGIAVTAAWDPSKTDIDDPNGTLFTLDASGAAVSMASPAIQEGQVTLLTRVKSGGILSTGFGYGVSPNTAGWQDAPPVPSPRFGVANGDYPGGFEVGISGSGSGRQVFTRSYLVAKGGAPRVVYNESEMVHNIRDLW